MDLRNAQWFGSVQVSGVREPIMFRGSMIGMVGEVLRALQTLHPRTRADGNKEIIIRFSDNPITDALPELARKALEVESVLAELEAEYIARLENESFDGFYERLKRDYNYEHDLALGIAQAEYGIEPTVSHKAWLSDPRAQEFRRMTASLRAMEAADPHELAALTRYCEEQYPEQVEVMNLS